MRYLWLVTQPERVNWRCHCYPQSALFITKDGTEMIYQRPRRSCLTFHWAVSDTCWRQGGSARCGNPPGPLPPAVCSSEPKGVDLGSSCGAHCLGNQGASCPVSKVMQNFMYWSHEFVFCFSGSAVLQELTGMLNWTQFSWYFCVIFHETGLNTLICANGYYISNGCVFTPEVFSLMSSVSILQEFLHNPSFHI